MKIWALYCCHRTEVRHEMKSRKVDNQSKSTKKRRAGRQRTGKSSAPRTAEQYFAKPARFQELWNRITQVISKMRSTKVSLQKASREFGVDSRTVVRQGGSALRKSANGRFEAKSSDRFLRFMVFPTHDGTREIAVRGSRPASQLGQYWAAVQRLLQTGDASKLQKFRGKKIRDANGNQISLVTDVQQLKRSGAAGVFSFESIYARVA